MRNLSWAIVLILALLFSLSASAQAAAIEPLRVRGPQASTGDAATAGERPGQPARGLPGRSPGARVPVVESTSVAAEGPGGDRQTVPMLDRRLRDPSPAVRMQVEPPAKKSKSAKESKAGEPAKRAKASKAGKRAKASKAGKRAKASKAGKPPKRVKASKPAKRAKASKAGKPGKPGKAGKRAKASPASRPVKASKRAKAAKRGRASKRRAKATSSRARTSKRVKQLKAKGSLDPAQARDAEILLKLGRISVKQNGSSTPAVIGQLKRASRQRLSKVPGVLVLPDSTDAVRKANSGSIPVVMVTGRLRREEVSREGELVVYSAKVEYVVLRMPHRSMASLMSGSASAKAPEFVARDKKRMARLKRNVLDAAVESALQDAPRALRSATK